MVQGKPTTNRNQTNHLTRTTSVVSSIVYFIHYSSFFIIFIKYLWRTVVHQILLNRCVQRQFDGIIQYYRNKAMTVQTETI